MVMTYLMSTWLASYRQNNKGIEMIGIFLELLYA